MTEEHRQRTIRLKLSNMASAPGGVIPTGFHAIDTALGIGGLPRGAIVELFGPASCGKTTLAIQIAAHLQANGLTAAWVDAEHTFDPARAAALGATVESLPVVQPTSSEQALEIARQLAISHGLDLLIVDSAAALVPELELEAGIGEVGLGLQGRVLASGLRRLAAAVAKTGASILFLNQTRTRRDASGGDEDTPAGSAALKLYSAVRIALCLVTNHRIRFRVLKNKAAAAFGEGELRWQPESGFAKSP
jgi:recombination protein RecA